MDEYMKCAECVCNAVAFIKKLADVVRNKDQKLSLMHCMIE